MPGPLSTKVAFGLSADLLIELVEPLPDDRSIYSEAVAAIGDAGHSQAVNYVLTLDWEEGRALMAECGYPPALEATTNLGDLRCIVYDARADVGAFLEIGEGVKLISLPMIAAKKRARTTWDGKEIYSLKNVLWWLKRNRLLSLQLLISNPDETTKQK